MKKYFLRIFFTLLILSGCGKKSSFSLDFDEFTMRMYENQKQYTEVQPEMTSPGVKVLKEYKETVSKDFTGFINSILVIRTSVETGLDIKELSDSNTKNLQLKLLKYKSTDNEARNVKCDDLEYSGYITAFSYQLDNETIYGGQYFFKNDEALYLISLQSEDKNDITSFIKSAKTVKCIK